jgi:DNA-binding transcriptional LysR family regulator
MSKIRSEDRVGRRLKFRDLQVLFAVAQSGSMAKAAAQLGVTQPAVSEIIASLEDMFEVRLFDRNPRGVEPTNYGVALLKRSAALFDELKQGIRDIDFLADPTAGELRIGCPESILAILSPMIERFCSQNPRVALQVEQVDNRTLELPGLRNRTNDLVLGHFALTHSDDHPLDDLNVETLFDDPPVVAVGMRSRWARRRTIDLAELIDEPWVLGTPGSWPNRIVLEAFRTRGLSGPKISLMTISIQLRADMVASGRFITTFPSSFVRLHADRLALKALPVDLPVRQWPLAIVTLKNRTLSPVVGRFIEHVRDFTRPMRETRPSRPGRPATGRLSAVAEPPAPPPPRSPR